MDQGLSEWNACSKPLGTWDTLWAFKLAFDCVMAYWNFARERAIRMPTVSYVFNRVILVLAHGYVICRDVEASPRHDAHAPRITNLNATNLNARPSRSHGTNFYATAPNNTARVSANLPYSNLYARYVISTDALWAYPNVIILD